jgi:predicted nucleic acid-binding protein
MPEVGRVVIVNTTPLIALALAGQLDLMRQLYREVLIPPTVRAEIMTGGMRRVGVAEFEAAPWIRTMPLQDPRRADLLSDLDRGEAEVLAMAQELHARLVILDERLARRHARRLGLPMTGTLGVLLRAKEQKLIAAVGPLIETIRRGGIRLGEPLVEAVLQRAGER